MSRYELTLRRAGEAARSIVSGFANDKRGTTAIEYGLIAAGIALAIITIIFALGGTLSSSFYGNLLAILLGAIGA